VKSAAALEIPKQPAGNADFKVGLITISDRASLGEYPTGDLSGQAMRDCCESFPNFFDITKQVIVNDNKDNIKSALVSMLDCNLIFTSGGTGFYERDNTPEATLEVIDKRADPLVMYVI